MIDLFVIQLFLVISIVIFLVAIGVIFLMSSPLVKNKKERDFRNKKYNEGV